ncbi:MAG TPA: energy transducer TonB [Chitinophagaceae bacterium]
MKKIVFLCLAAAVSLTGFCQTDQQLRELDSARKALAFSGMVYPYIDSSPGYPGGDAKWSEYVATADLMKETIARAKEQKVPAGRYAVMVRFAVNADSTLSEVKVVGKKAGYGFDEAAIKLVQGSGKWIPAHVEGKHIKSHLQLPVKFTITRND